MNFLQELHKNQYITEEDNSAIPEDSIKELQKMIRKGVENSGQWSNALEVVHKAYEVTDIQRPTPDMAGAWTQYETLITYAVQQLTKVHGINGTWRMTSEDFTEKSKYIIEYHTPNNGIELIDIEANNVDEIVEYFTTGLNNCSTKKIQQKNSTIVEFWEYGTIKSKKHLKILEK